MRELIFTDVFRMSRILKKIDIKNKLGDLSDKSQEDVGAAMILAIIENLGAAEKEINEFMGDLVGLTGEEFGALPIAKSMEYFAEFKDQPGIKDFFKSAGQLMK